MQSYVVTSRGANGEPRAIRCTAHTDCTWTASSPGAKRDDDPLYVALFQNHLKDRATPDRAMMGHPRRLRK